MSEDGEGWAPLTLPVFIADETLYSWSSRYHRQSGNALASATAKQLFGRARVGAQHDLPCGLAALALRTRGLLGETAELIYERTLLSFYLPLRTPQVQAIAGDTLRGSRLGHLKFRLGMLTSRFGAHHPLKTCPACLAVMVERGAPYWRLSHQWPGMWVCPEHGAWLQATRIKVHGIERFQWRLPDDVPWTDAPPMPVTPACRALAAAVAGWCDLPAGFSFSLYRMAATYRRGVAAAMGSHGGSLNVAAAIEGYATWSRGLAVGIAELAPLLVRDAANAASLLRTLRAPRGAGHPLRHLAVIAWLFPSWEDFLAAYRDESAALDGVERPSTARPTRHDAQSAVCRLMQLGFTASAAARKVDVAVATAQRWAANAGLPVRRRPKALKAALRRRIKALLAKGTPHQAAALACGVSLTTVRRVLEDTPGLHARWQAQVAKTQRKHARRAWVRARARAPAASRTQLRARAPAAYAWLYRNDREWLSAHQPRPLARKREGAQLRLDWSARDAELCVAVTHAARALRKEGAKPPYALWRMCQQLPDLRPKLRVMARLPRTRDLLCRLVRRRGQRLPIDASRYG